MREVHGQFQGYLKKFIKIELNVKYITLVAILNPLLLTVITPLFALHSGNVQFNFLHLDSLNTQYLKGSEVFNLKRKIYLTILTVIPKPILI